jgi:hypothetical protein
MERPANQTRWQEWITLFLGAWIFISPWVFGFSGTEVSAWNYFIVGAVMFIFSGVAISNNESAEWVSLVAAAWLFISPWVTSLAAAGGARGDAVISGILGVVFAAWGLAQHQRRTIAMNR